MLNRLIDDPSQPVEVQRTAFSLDVQGRYICNTWDEAVNNGGFAFDAIVIGAGMYGAYIAEKIYRAGASDNVRVLVLEAGDYLISEHIQNTARLGLNVPGPTTVDPGTRERVWGLPWRSNTAFPGLAYCLGGRSLYWGGWSPRLTSADLAHWPNPVAQYLQANYDKTEQETGVVPSTDFVSGPLFDELMKAFDAAAAKVPTVKRPIEEAPLAVQGNSPSPGIFPFDKYSSAPIFIDAVREEAQSNPDSTRRLFLVPRAHVTRLITSNGLVTGIDLLVDGQPKFLAVQPSCAVILAASTIESTRLALESFPTPQMGRNLMAHLRSNLTVRIKRAAFSPTLPRQLETAALLVRGETPQGRYHLQVTASAVQGANAEAVMWRMIPDIDLLDQALASEQADSIVITLRGIGEMTGDQQATSQNTSTSWMDLSPFDRDEFGMRRAWINLVSTPAQDQLWKTLDDASLALVQKIAVQPSNLEYFYDNNWHSAPPPFGKVRDTLGTTHHEAGTLWMGSQANNSVTDLEGRFHHIGNAFVAGPALFPTLGSANPSLTAFTLARRTATAVVAQIRPAPEAGMTQISTASLAGWQMAGSGRFNQVGRDILESQDGIGLLWYTKEQFADFLLRVDWRASSPTDNSGVFLRFPSLGPNDWQTAVDHGFEIQIDDTGFNPTNNTFHDPTHMTGAIYAIAPASTLASRPVGEWNTFEIEAIGNFITVKLNGTVVSQLTHDAGRPLKGHIGLQNHHPGSRVEFRNIRIKTIGAALTAGGSMP